MSNLTEQQVAEWLNEQSEKHGVRVSIFSGSQPSFHVSDGKIIGFGHSTMHGTGPTIEAAIADMRTRGALIRESLANQLKELLAP